MRSKFKYLLACCLFLLLSVARGQNINLKIIAKEQKSNLYKLNYKKKFFTKQAAYKEIENIVLSLQFKGYLLASVDSLYGDSLNVVALFDENALYNTAVLRLGNLNPNLASRLGVSEKLYFGKPFRYREVARSLEDILRYYENNGYPFVTAALDSVQVSGNQISAVLNVQKNKFYKLDSIKIVGSARVNKNFLYRYLGIKENMPYNEALLMSISEKVRQLPFVTEIQVQRVQLTPRSNKLELFLDKKKATQLDGIVGFLPDADTKKTIITGDVKLKLVNEVLHNGETFDLQWRRLKSQTSDFSGQVIYPYIFGTPVGIDYAIKIYRRDTTFIDISNNVGLQYYFSGLNNLKVYYKQHNSNLISTSGYSLVTTLPDYADILTRSYGVGLALNRLDYRFNPKKGFAITVNAQTGTRTVQQNPKINPLAYKDLLLQSTQYQFEGNLAYYLNIAGNNVIKFGLQGASVFGNSTIFRNELFRIGGLRTLRGFDEESIFASTYAIPTIEYRFLFAQNSNIVVFAEGAWYENNSNHEYVKDTPMSLGAGVNFETKAGILSLNYALGNQLGNGFDLRSGKIHFGLTGLF